MEIGNLENTGFDTLFRGFERAFADYDIRFGREEVRSMLERRGYNPRLSFAAFEGGEIVAFTLNGIGSFRGVPTAYDTGTGTAAEYRGRGLAGQIFAHALPHLREAGIRQYVLEVLQSNSSAIAVYRRMNFRVTREFDCFRQSIADISGLEVPSAEYAVEPVDIDFVRNACAFCAFEPSWQNGIESIERGAAGLTFLGVSIGGEPAGCCVFDPLTGDLTMLSVRREYRRQGIATRLLAEAVLRMQTDFVKALNISSDDGSMPAFLARRNIVPASRQYEMMLSI